MRRSILASAFLSVLFSLLVISCSSHDSSTSTTSESSDALTALAAIAVPASDTMTIGNYVLVSKVRYGRTAYDYTFRASMSNSGSQYAQGVRAVLFSSVQTTVVISGALDFGDIAPGETVQSQNTFTVRIDRLYAFNESDLIWEIQADFPEAVGMIDSSGGTVEVTDPQSSLSGAKVIIPACETSAVLPVTIDKTSLHRVVPDGLVTAGPFIELGPDGTHFSQPILVTIPYEDEDYDGIVDGTDASVEDIIVRTFNKVTGEWEDLEIVSRDAGYNTITFKTTHFSGFGTFVDQAPSDNNTIVLTVDGLNFYKLVVNDNPYLFVASPLIYSSLYLHANISPRPGYLQEVIEDISDQYELGLNKADIITFDGSSSPSNNYEAWSGDPDQTIDMVSALRLCLEKIWATKGNKKFIIICHSWGTILTELALSYEKDISPDLLITLSSPLGSINANTPDSFLELYYSSRISNYSYEWIDKTRDALGEPERSISSLGYDMKWINYWANGDMISGPLNLLQCDDEKVDRSTSPIYRNLDNTHLWHAVTSLSKVKMDEEDDYNPSGESIYEEFGKPFIEKVKDQLQAIIGYTTPPDQISTLVGTMVWIPAGSFQMGSTDNTYGYAHYTTPVHTVTLSGFYLGATEVTQAQYLAVMGTNPSYFQGTGRENCPVVRVTWNDAREFCARLTAMTPGYVFTLPSEAQWEYACRAGTTTLYSFGDSDALIGDYAWTWANSDGQNGDWYGTHPVGTRLPNPWGLYDMHGNVWEWCLDSWHWNYTGAPTDGSAWEPDTGSTRMFRGGGWGTYPWACRLAIRSYNYPDYDSDYIGFRVLAVPAVN